MARCEKCKMDPCLCHLSGFGENFEENMDKELQSMIKKRCILKISKQGEEIYEKYISKKMPHPRENNVYGIIKMIGIYTDDNNESEEDEDVMIEDFLGKRKKLMFYVEYEDIQKYEGHWYLEEEVILLND